MIGEMSRINNLKSIVTQLEGHNGRIIKLIEKIRSTDKEIKDELKTSGGILEKLKLQAPQLRNDYDSWFRDGDNVIGDFISKLREYIGENKNLMSIVNAIREACCEQQEGLQDGPRWLQTERRLVNIDLDGLVDREWKPVQQIAQTWIDRLVVLKDVITDKVNALMEPLTDRLENAEFKDWIPELELLETQGETDRADTEGVESGLKAAGLLSGKVKTGFLKGRLAWSNIPEILRGKIDAVIGKIGILDRLKNIWENLRSKLNISTFTGRIKSKIASIRAGNAWEDFDFHPDKLINGFSGSIDMDITYWKFGMKTERTSVPVTDFRTLISSTKSLMVWSKGKGPRKDSTMKILSLTKETAIKMIKHIKDEFIARINARVNGITESITSHADLKGDGDSIISNLRDSRRIADEPGIRVRA